MKYLKALLLISCLFQFERSMAQGNNLQFNQAIYNTIVGTITGFNGEHLTIQNFTVPPNKVWKIESAAAGFTRDYGSPESGLYSGGTLAINDIVIFSTPFQYGPISLLTLPNLSNLPIWLPSGNYDLILTTWEETLSGPGPTPQWKGFISGIEYNIVP